MKCWEAYKGKNTETVPSNTIASDDGGFCIQSSTNNTCDDVRSSTSVQRGGFKKKYQEMEVVDVTDSAASPELCTRTAKTMGKVQESMYPIRCFTELISERLWRYPGIGMDSLCCTLWFVLQLPAVCCRKQW